MQNARPRPKTPSETPPDITGYKFRYFLIGLAAILLLGSGAGMAQTAPTSPDGAAQFMRELSERTLGVLSWTEQTSGGRQARIRALIEENFAFTVIGRYVAGKAWRKASPGQRGRYQQSFKSWVLNGFTKRLSVYSSGGMKILGGRKTGRRDALVSTLVTRPSGPAIEARWRVRATPQGYRILDIMIGGVSMALTQRAEFRSVIRRQGMGGLIQRLQTQSAEIQGIHTRQLASSQN